MNLKDVIYYIFGEEINEEIDFVDNSAVEYVIQF